LSDEPPRLAEDELSREEEQAARSTLRYVVRFLAVLAVLAGLALAITSQLGSLPDISWHFRPGWLALAVACFVALQMLHAAIWRLIIRWLHGELEWSRCLAIWSASNMGKYVPTSLLAFVMRVTMTEHAGVPKRVTSASIVYELALVMTAAVTVGAYGVIQLPELQGEAVRWLVLGLPLVAFLVLQPKVFRRVAEVLLNRMKSEPLPETLSLGRILVIAALYCGSLLIAGLGTYAFAQTLVHVGAADAATAVAAFSLGLVLSYVGFLLPAGIGAREAAFTAALAPAMPATVAVAVAIGVRLVQMAIEVVFALVTPVLARRRERTG
jgi:hypothetical protein